MRIRIAALFLGCIALTAPRARAQAPGQLPPGSPSPPPSMTGPGAPPGPPPGMMPGPSALPLPQAYPPPPWPQNGLPPSLTSPPPPPPPPPTTLPPAAAEAPQLKIAGRVGFGIGIYAAPGLSRGASTGGASGALGGLGALPSYGGALGIRWWVKERLVVLPSLSMSINRTSAPSATDAYGNYTQGGSFTSGVIAPTVSLGYAVYRGKSTRVLVVGGVGFTYSAQGVLQDIPTTDSTRTSRYVTAKTLDFNVPFGFALEQFFTPRISAVVGAQAPIFDYWSTKIGAAEANSSIGANFNAAQLGASVFFYTD